MAVRDWIHPVVSSSHIATLDVLALPMVLHPASLSVATPDALRSLLMGFVFHQDVSDNVSLAEPRWPSPDVVVGPSRRIGVRLIAISLSARLAPGHQDRGEGMEVFARLEEEAASEADERDRWFQAASTHAFPSALSILPPTGLASALTECVVSRLVSGWIIDLADRGLPLTGEPLIDLRRHVLSASIEVSADDESLFVVHAQSEEGPLSPVVLPRTWVSVGAVSPLHEVLRDLLNGTFSPAVPASSAAPAPLAAPRRRLH